MTQLLDLARCALQRFSILLDKKAVSIGSTACAYQQKDGAIMACWLVTRVRLLGDTSQLS